ncbi:LysR family transcriptional regulator [Vibrio panuliri]|uniref:LysR family transcriptional regulator n=1 Tax=Vibrio panuliri TaxID=1381081 RepID=A0A1Q9HMZ2_9VIBR|nr:LysR substrate-binding domain-containing protein [Vibrio panuliri]OLQ92103.1 LysR family transcriptional regulator [Vibrio panuliri]
MKTRSEDLNLLIAVVDNGGFSSAAEALGIQVAKVSRAVNRVEQSLGVTILNRTTRRIELTNEGIKFVESIREALHSIEKAEMDIQAQGESPEGNLRVDAASPFIFHQLIPLMAEFHATYPDIQLELTSNEGFVDLIEKRTDVAIRIGRLEDSSLHARALGMSQLYIVASPKYLSSNGVPHLVSDLSHHKLIGFTAPKILNQWPLPDLPTIEPNIRASNGETVRQLVLTGNGIAVLSGFMVKEDIEAGRLVSLMEAIKLTNTGREQINAVYYRTSNVARRISAFIDFIQPRLTL